jgi:hypothetical protein
MGNRPLYFFQSVEGNIERIDKNANFNPTKSGPITSSKCVALFIDSFNYRIINEEEKYSELFHEGMNVKFWIYKTGYDYNFVQASNSGELLIKNNEIKGWIIFSLLILSSMLFMVILFIFFFRKRISVPHNYNTIRT